MVNQVAADHSIPPVRKVFAVHPWVFVFTVSEINPAREDGRDTVAAVVLDLLQDLGCGLAFDFELEPRQVPDIFPCRLQYFSLLVVDAHVPRGLAAPDEAGASIAIEGWPGRAPWQANLCCTPETYRSFIKDLGCKSVGVNYDPSHLIRLGVDHIRFLNEFAPRVFHVHGKDTELIADALYEYGSHQGSVFSKNHGFGELAWRYTIPGSGCTRWCEVLKILKSSGYKGAVSVELEDENFNGSEDGEKAGLLHSLAFLKGA